MQWRWIILITSLIISVLTLTFNQNQGTQTPLQTSGELQSHQLISDTGSGIKIAVCSLLSARKSSLRNGPLVQNIVNELSEETHVVILVNDLESFQYTGNADRVTFLELPEASHLSIWPQDPFLILEGSGTPKMVVSKKFDRGDDLIMAEQLSSQLDLAIIETDLHFEGGNIVCSSEKIFIGRDTVSRNMADLGANEGQIISRFEKLLGASVHIVGTTPQPIGHIDLIVTPLGAKVISVADSNLGAEIVQKVLDQSPREILRFIEECENDFFGSDQIESVTDLAGNQLVRPNLKDGLQHAIQYSRELSSDLDAIASDLEKQGFRIVRAPALVSNLEGKEIRFPILTYNNVLLETRNEQNIVYLPQYGLNTLDQAAYTNWESLGYLVKPVEGFATSAMYGGSLRCCTKVLLRD